MSNPNCGCRCDGRASVPDAFPQIARSGPPIGAEANRRYVSTDCRDIIRNGGGKELGRGRRGGYHRSFVEADGPIAVWGPVNDCAVTQPVPSDHDRTGNLELLLER